MLLKIRKNLIFYISIILTIIAILYFFNWHLQLGLKRYFDVDEYAHLHWGYSLFIGERPYTDFFYIFPPFFLYPVYLIFMIFGRTITALLAARVMMFIIFLLSAIVLFLIGKKIKNVKTALFAVFIFAFLPLPEDKMIEIRPDMIATLLSLLGLYIMITAVEKKKLGYYFLSGASYSLGLGVVPKTIFFLIPVVIYLIYGLLRNIITTSSKKLRFLEIEATTFCLGFLIPGIILISLLIIFGNPVFGFYSMSKLSSNTAYVLGHKFYMFPHHFFWPNQTYYGLWDYSAPYIANLIVYWVSMLMFILRFVGSLSYPDRNKSIREFLVSASFFANLYAFIYIFPLKHAQYLIPLAPFVSYYFADFVTTVSEKINIKTAGAVFYIIILFTFSYIGFLMNREKINWTNDENIASIKKINSLLPKETVIFDTTGETIMFPNGHYFCCLPYGQYQEVLLFKIPNIETEMRKRGTDYVYGGLGRLNVLPVTEAEYVRQNFENYLPDGSILKRKNK